MTVDRSLLPGTSPFDLMDRESARLEEFLGDLVARGDDDPGWRSSTRCDAWDVRALFGHLRHIEDYNQACVDGRVRELLGTSRHDVDAFNAAGVRQYADVPVAELFEQWRRLNADYRKRMRERGDGVVDTSVGDYPSLFQAYYLSVEYATHGDDLGITSSYDGRDAWRAAFTRFALTEQDKPAALTPRHGSTVIRLRDQEFELSDHDLAEAGVARLPADHPAPRALRALVRCCA